jgi:hypothetical protein
MESSITSYSPAAEPGERLQALWDLYSWTFSAFKIKGFVLAMNSSGE